MKNIKNFFIKKNDVNISTQADSLSRAHLDIEEQYWTICEISKDAVIVLDTKGKILYCNAVYFSYSGYSPEEIIGRHFLMIPAFIYSELPKIAKVFLRLLRGNKISGFEFKFKMKTGQVRIGIAEMAPLYSNRKVAGILGIIKDVTEQRAAFEKLKRHEEKISSIEDTERSIEMAEASLNSVPDAVFWMDKNARLVNVNKSALTKLGYSREELLNMQIFDIDPVYTKKRWSEGWDIFKKGTTSYFESVHRKKDGTEFPVEVTINFLNFSGQEYVFALAVDITEKNKRDAIIRESEERYKSLVETMFEGMWTLDCQAITTFVNPQMAAILGYEIWEMAGKPFVDFIDDSLRESILGILFNNKIEHKSENIYTFIRKDEKKAFLHLEIFQPVQGEISAGITLYVTDVTRKIMIEEELKLKDSAMEASMNAIAILDLSYRVVYANESFVRIFGYKNKHDATGRAATEFIVVDESFQTASKVLFDSGNISGDYMGMKPDGETFNIELYANLVKKNGKPLAVMISVVDITARKMEAERIRYLSFHDGLTGLYNRAYFEEELKRLDTPRQLPLSFIIGDLNSLKLVNDSYGHRFGDAMITRAAKIIKKFCRDEDVIARWGGDEFVILLPRADNDTAGSIIERIRRACEAYTYKKIPLSIALGTASKVSQDESMNTVIKDAEDNMYKRKVLERKSISGTIILSLEATLSGKSFETKEHAERLKKLAVKLGKMLNLPENQIGELSLLATLHDIGKVAIPESILTKEGNLNKKEWEVVRRHPEIGSNIASSSPQISHIAGAILAAHEYWDGSGYPRGIKGEEIPLISRLVHIVDAFDVMRNGRPYKKALNKAGAIRELRSRAGTQFDPMLTEEFISMLEQ